MFYWCDCKESKIAKNPNIAKEKLQAKRCIGHYVKVDVDSDDICIHCEHYAIFSPENPRPKDKTGYQEKDHTDVFSLFEQGFSFKEIAEKLNKKYITVNKLITRKYGKDWKVQQKSFSTNKNPDRVNYPDRKDVHGRKEVIDLFLAGLSMNEISERLKKPYPTVNKWIKDKFGKDWKKVVNG